MACDIHEMKWKRKWIIFGTEAKELGEGCSRRVFTWKKGWVIKVPLGEWEDDSWARRANLNEYYRYLKLRNKPDKNGIYYTKCKLLKCGCLLMESVKIWDKMNQKQKAKKPAWADWLSDGYQLGTNSKGKWVCYDHGDVYCRKPRKKKKNAASLRRAKK